MARVRVPSTPPPITPTSILAHHTITYQSLCPHLEGAMRTKTRNRNPGGARLFYFIYSQMIFNIWVMARILLRSAMLRLSTQHRLKTIAQLAFKGIIVALAEKPGPPPSGEPGPGWGSDGTAWRARRDGCCARSRPLLVDHLLMYRLPSAVWASPGPMPTRPVRGAIADVLMHLGAIVWDVARTDPVVKGATFGLADVS